MQKNIFELLDLVKIEILKCSLQAVHAAHASHYKTAVFDFTLKFTQNMALLYAINYKFHIVQAAHWSTS